MLSILRSESSGLGSREVTGASRVCVTVPNLEAPGFRVHGEASEAEERNLDVRDVLETTE